MIIELPNFLPVSLQNHLEKHLTSNHFPWHFLKDVTSEHDNYHAGFHHTPFLDGVPKTMEYDSILFLSHYVRDVLKNDNLILHRVRYGINVRSSDDIDYNTPHLDFADDFPKKHYTVLYYVNDSDGDTVIFNETKRSKEYTVLKRISPEKGKMCIFDGEHFHASSRPKKSDFRIVITLNLYDPS
jgi:hypothetical protein